MTMACTLQLSECSTLCVGCIETPGLTALWLTGSVAKLIRSGARLCDLEYPLTEYSTSNDVSARGPRIVRIL